MSIPITLFVIPGDKESQKAVDLVKKFISETDFQVQTCPSSMATQYAIPFLKDEERSPFYGLDAIQHFLTKRYSQAA